MNIVLTGSSGYVGSCLAHRLIKEGHGVWGFDKDPPRPSLKGIANYHHTRVDLSDLTPLRQACIALPDIDVGIHAAASQALQHPMELTEVVRDNCLGTANLLRVADEKSILHWIMLSSSGVYGQPQPVPVSENSPTHPHSAYGLSKLHAEELFRFYCQHHGMHAVVLRCDRVYGIGQQVPGLVQYLIQTLESYEDVELFSHGNIPYDPVYIDDVIGAVQLAIQHVAKQTLDVFNIGGGAPASSRELAETIKKRLKSSSNIIVRSYDNPSYSPTAVMDISRARSILGFSPGSLTANMDIMLKQ
ncbi:MAG: NAD(P)-dependent oxidoreductase [Magnetococcales bacterium]|nr:NAD(P)-dependent oxidoreductase [Magnetococcales bacterium]